MNEPKIAQALGGNAIIEDPDDEPGLEMAKGARVWRVYVKETDRSDKEMVDGRNKFIIESLKDLKPDYTGSSAKALLAISHKLDAIAGGQRTTPLLVQELDSDAFSPPHASVIVNVLWLLSLSLSVAVSLIAMLSKEWCYKFMIGRSGQAYDQGRRRQQKWNGMERWKMQEVLTYLPGLMHIALLLFATGMCIYLWDVNVGVAVPVTAVTSVATCIYVAVTVLPWFNQFCPYSTPVTSINNASTRNIAANLWGTVHRVVYSMVNRAYWWVEHPKWLEFALKRLRDWAEPARNNTADPGKEDAYASMDPVTSQMLAWMIVNCDDSQSVNVALQAIAGARGELPHAELVKNGAVELVEAQLLACVQMDASSGEYLLKNADMLYPALRYGRAYGMLAWRKFQVSAAIMSRNDSRSPDLITFVTRVLRTNVPKIQIDLTRYAESVSANSGVLATAWAGCVYLSYARFVLDTESLGAFFSRCISGDGTQIPEPALLSLIESCTYYSTGGQSPGAVRLQDPLLSILVDIFLMHQDSALNIARMIAITFATTAFVVDSYPGGEQPTRAMEDQNIRAERVLCHYQKVNPTTEEIDRMFTFGLIGLLPHMSIEALKTTSVARLSKLYDIITRTLNSSQCDIFTLPESHNWSAHLTSSHKRLMPENTVDPALLFSNTASLDALLLRAQLHHDRSFVPALIFLYNAQSKELQDACINALILQPVAVNQSQTSALQEYQSQLQKLLGYFFVSDGPLDLFFTFYFKLLVATCMLCSVSNLSGRQSVLKPLVNCHDDFKQLTATLSDGELPTEDEILQHVAEPIDGGDEYEDHLLRTMQLIVNFCHADPRKLPRTKPDQGGSETSSWAAKLQKIKNRFDSTLRPNPAGAANPCRLPYV
ncbi:hypothetical protein FRC09_009844 [Ceratobasidium sp. 395]|nr:hypothetical protein FRC09_009844 [Ceratobasidium sp. 395]